MAVWIAAIAAAAPSADAAPKSFTYAITSPTYGTIGTYDRTSDEADGTTTATARLQIVVKVLGIVLHRETAIQTEVWRDDRLMSFQSLTMVNGRPLAIHGEARDNRFMVTGPKGTKAAPADIVASDPWSLNRMGHAVVVSIKTGKVDEVEVTGGETETVMLAGARAPVRHFHVSTVSQPNKWEVWINPQGLPVKFRAFEQGAAVDFTLISTSPQTAAVASTAAVHP